MNIIYGICSWGLGHATRSLPILRRLFKEGHELTIISHDRSLQLLKKELNDQVTYIDLPDYPILVSENKEKFIAKSMVYWPLFIKRMESGLNYLKKIVERTTYDCIISDGRYDMYHKHIPSYFISHQIRILNPLNIGIFETGSERFNEFFFRRFRDIIIPDYETDDFSGKLSHDFKRIDKNRLHYVGVLSDFSKKKKKKDIDYFISISGPEPQRSILENKLRSQVNDLSGSVVMTLGKTEDQTQDFSDHIKIYDYLSKEQREDLLNRSNIVISRSGYSTILDLAVIGCKALMIPTPGQIEQEYLAEYHMEKKTCHAVDQDNLNISADVALVNKTKGFNAKKSVEDAVENVMKIISI